ncbi:hypothetical protein [Actinomyces sp. S4-C9]|nr:hypothetical protein [Actinomyces sp. S4-C9]
MLWRFDVPRHRSVFGLVVSGYRHALAVNAMVHEEANRYYN